MRESEKQEARSKKTTCHIHVFEAYPFFSIGEG